MWFGALGRCRSEQHKHALVLSRELLNDIRASLTSLNSERKQERIIAWKKWCESALQGSQVIAIHDTKGELTPERVAEGALQAWAGLWRAHQAVPEAQGTFVQDSLDDAPLPALKVQDLRACLAQPAGQGKGVDSWTGAELKSLPQVALQGLVHLYGRFEALGSFPPGAQCVLEVLLDKGVGDQPLSQRNIGMLPKVYRVWCRRNHLQDWRRGKNWTWAWGTGPGRGAEDAAWLAHFDVGEAQVLGWSSAEVLLDSEKCYERIRLDIAEQRMRSAGFPGRLGRLALAQCWSPGPWQLLVQWPVGSGLNVALSQGVGLPRMFCPWSMLRGCWQAQICSDCDCM